MTLEEKIKKENTRYSNEDKHYNHADLELFYLLSYVECVKEESEQEKYLLSCIEEEINRLRYSIDIYKKLIDEKHYKKIEEIKKGI